MVASHVLPSGSDAENFLEQSSVQSTTGFRPKAAVVGTMLVMGIGLVAFWTSGTHNGNSVGAQSKGTTFYSILDEIPDFEPFEITPCNPFLELAAMASHDKIGKSCDETTNKCGNVVSHTCEAPGWVFCQNAVCDETPVKNGSKWVSNCHCWQQKEGGTVKNLIPSTKNSGANCVLDMGPGGPEMCEAMGKGALWSTFGVDDPAYLPGKPLKAATCEKHTLWAWCWGAPCKKVGDDIQCACPIMKSMNDAKQMLSLAGDAQCPPNVANPCEKGWTHNSMPAGTSPSEYMKSGKEALCYTE